MSEFRVVVICSTDKSDLYFANQLMKQVNVVGVMVENQRHELDTTPVVIKALRLIHKPMVLVSKLLEKFKAITSEKYADYNRPEFSTNFGGEGNELFPGEQVECVYTTGVNNINAPQYVEWLKRRQADLVAVCGASLLREDILVIPKNGVLNLHGGLAQKYRGLFTTDWAVYKEQPEYVGATVHFVSPGIDDGDVIYQGRPKIELGDDPHSLYVKVVKLGINMVVQAIFDLQEGKTKSEPLLQKGDLYLGKMYTHKIKVATWKKMRKSIIKDYLADKARRDKEVRAIMMNVFPESH